MCHRGHATGDDGLVFAGIGHGGTSSLNIRFAFRLAVEAPGPDVRFLDAAIRAQNPYIMTGQTRMTATGNGCSGAAHIATRRKASPASPPGLPSSQAATNASSADGIRTFSPFWETCRRPWPQIATIDGLLHVYQRTDNNFDDYMNRTPTTKNVPNRSATLSEWASPFLSLHRTAPPSPLSPPRNRDKCVPYPTSTPTPSSDAAPPLAGRSHAAVDTSRPTWMYPSRRVRRGPLHRLDPISGCWSLRGGPTGG